MSDKLRFGEILVRNGLLERSALQRVLAEAEENTFDLGEVLVQRGLVEEGALIQTVARALNIPSVSLASVKPEQRAAKMVPRAFCVAHMLIPVGLEKSQVGEHLLVAMANPSDIQAIKRITRQARMRIRPLVALAREIREAIPKYYGGSVVPGPTPAASTPDGKDSIFDFGVTDLSSYSEPPRPVRRSAPPPSVAPPRVAPPRVAPPRVAPPRIAVTVDRRPPMQKSPQNALSPEVMDAITNPQATTPAVRGTGLHKLSESPRAVRSMRPLPSAPPRMGRLSTGARSAPPPPFPATHIDSTVPRPSQAPQPISMIPSHVPLEGGLVGEPTVEEDIHGLFDALTGPIPDASTDMGDQVITTYLEQYGPAPDVDAGERLRALELALDTTASPTAKLLVALIRQLTRRGLVDADALFADYHRK